MASASSEAVGLANKVISWLGGGAKLLAVLLIFQGVKRATISKRTLNEHYDISLASLTALGLSVILLVMIGLCIKAVTSGLLIMSIMAGSFFLFIPATIIIIMSVWSFFLAIFTLKYRLSILLSASTIVILGIVRIAAFGL
jgi:hypothetical protein